MFVKLRLYKEGIYGKQPDDQQVIFRYAAIVVRK